MLSNICPDAHLVISNLVVLEGAFKRPERNTIPFRSFVGLGVLVCHCLLNVFYKIASDRADYLEKVVWIVLLAHPQRNILVAKRILAELLELGDFALAKLSKEAAVLRPEEPHIWDFEQFHSKPFQSESSSPPALMSASTFLEYKIVDDSTAEHFHPFSVIEYLQL